MGLDMYLDKYKKAGNFTTNEICKIDKYYRWKSDKDNGSFEEWAGFPLKEVPEEGIKLYKNLYVPT